LPYNLLLAVDQLCLGKPAASIHFTVFHNSNSEKQPLHFLQGNLGHDSPRPTHAREAGPPSHKGDCINLLTHGEIPLGVLSEVKSCRWSSSGDV